MLLIVLRLFFARCRYVQVIISCVLHVVGHFRSFLACCRSFQVVPCFSKQPKCHCFSHSGMSRIQKFFLLANHGSQQSLFHGPPLSNPFCQPWFYSAKSFLQIVRFIPVIRPELKPVSISSVRCESEVSVEWFLGKPN